MTEAEAKAVIEAVAPSLEATIEKNGDGYRIDVFRLAEDGWMGWHVQVVHTDLQDAHALALADVKRQVAREAEIAAAIEAEGEGGSRH